LSRPRLLFTSTLHTPFLDDDLRILRRHADVDVLIARGPFAFLRVAPRLLRADLSFTWFASVYAFPVVAGMHLLGRPSLIAVGGVDATRMPDIGYGLWNSTWKGSLAGYALRHASAVLVVDGCLRERLVELAGYDGRNIRVIPTGFDAEFWSPGAERTRTVLTVAACENEVRLQVKGIPLLLETARLMPDVPFRVVGPFPDLLGPLRRKAPSNMIFEPPVPRNDLREYYRLAAVYCQPSRSEGLPNSVCEAMLCGCIPVGTDVGGMRSAIGESGYVVPPEDPHALAGAIQTALEAGEPMRIKARSRVAGLFTVDRRERGIVLAMKEALG
jgi:glycosyltransferase involved in cell wall biosynthesis